MPARPLILLLVYDVEKISGIQWHVQDLLDHQEPGRFRFAALTNNAACAASLAERGVPCLEREIDRWTGSGVASLLRDLARSHGRPGLVHLHGFVTGVWGPLAVRAALGRVPVLQTPNSVRFKRRWLLPLFRRLWRASLAVARAHVIAVSASEREEIAGLGVVPASRLHLVANGIRLDRLPPPEAREAARRALGLPEGAPVVGMMGRLHPQKDPLTFVGAALVVARERPDARFVIVGGGDLEGEVRRLGAPLGERLVLPGWREDGRALCRAFDVAVSTSRYEGLSLSLLDLLGMGLPTVATAVTGNLDVVDGTTGRLVPPADPEATARAILELLADPEGARRLGAAARARVEREHTSAAMARRTAALYDAVIAAGASRRRPLHSAPCSRA